MSTRVELRSAALGCIALALVAMSTAGCGSNPGGHADPQADGDLSNHQQLMPDEVRAIMQSAARALDADLAIAVADRRGVILGVGTKAKHGSDFTLNYQAACTACRPTAIEPSSTCADCAVVNLAIQLARTAAFFSADQTPLTSRSVRFLSGEHFPPGIMNTAAAALFGIENTNRGCSFDANSNPLDSVVPRARSLSALADPSACDALHSTAGCTTGIATLPGGVPIYKNGRMSGGIGVAIRGAALDPDPVAAFEEAVLGEPPRVLRRSDADGTFTTAEFAARAFSGDTSAFPLLAPKGLKGVCHEDDAPACCAQGCFFGILPAASLPFDPVIFVDGIEIPEVDFDPSVSGVGSGNPITNFIVDPTTTTWGFVPSNDVTHVTQTNWLVGPADGDGISTADARAIVNAAVQQALTTRAAIRLPLEARAQMVVAVSDRNGALVGLFRMPDATTFSIDVAVSKSRNVLYFSEPNIQTQDMLDCPGESDCREQAFPAGTAITNRTLSFGAQPFFPSGIEGSLTGYPPPFAPGPFRKIFLDDSAQPCTNGHQPPQELSGRQSGIVFFPGSAPLYRGGQLVGGLGVSGDGVEQDDLVTFAATDGFDPPDGIRADNLSVRGVRLPYLKFNRQPQK